MLASTLLLALAGSALAAPKPSFPSGMRRHVVRPGETYPPGSPHAIMAEQIRYEMGGNYTELVARAGKGGANAFIVHDATALTMSRMDPVAFPGQVAPHVHIVQGASNFRNVLNTPSEQQNADCTTAVVSGDRSNYWQPSLYYRNDDGKFRAAPQGITRIYYRMHGPNIQPFPQGLRMVSGTAMSRDRSDIRTEGINVIVDGKYNPDGPFLPNSTSYPNGYNTVVLLVNFPSCGKADGQLDSKDNFSHMAWPQMTRDGRGRWDGWYCPDSHPIKYPQILYEIAWYFDRSKKQQLVLSNGDTLGSSLHGDFVSGWDMELLAQAIAQNGNGNGCGETLKDCPVFSDSAIDDNAGRARQCRYAGQIPDEDVGLYAPLDQLPGCNPLWEANGPVDKPMNCPWYQGDPGWVSPNAYMLYDKKTVPQAVKVPEGDTIANVSHPNILDSRLGVWGTDDLSNKGRVLVGTDEEVRAGGVKKAVADVYGLQTSCAFSGTYPPCPATVYQTFGTDMEATPVVANVCGATNTKGAVFNTKAYIPGPKATITTIGCDGAAPTNVTLPTNTTSTPGPTNTTTSDPLPTNTTSGPSSTGIPSNTTTAGPTSSGNTTALPTSSGNTTTASPTSSGNTTTAGPTSSGNTTTAGPTSSGNTTAVPSTSSDTTATPTASSSTSGSGTAVPTGSDSATSASTTESATTTESGSATSASTTESSSATSVSTTESSSATTASTTSVSPTGEPTGSGSDTASPTATGSSSATTTGTTSDASPTDEPTASASSTGEPTASASSTGEPTASASSTGEPTSASNTGEPTGSETGSDTATPTSSSSTTSCSGSSTETPSSTTSCSGSGSSTATPSDTGSGSATPSPTGTYSPEPPTDAPSTTGPTESASETATPTSKPQKSCKPKHKHKHKNGKGRGRGKGKHYRSH